MPLWRSLIALLLLASPGFAQDQVTDFPPEVAAWYVNQDGSCVQCSLGHCGVWQNNPSFANLLWDTQYGPRVRGGSYPSRVEAYANKREVPIYNVTGKPTYEWMKWAAKTGRMCAIGCYSSHFQTLLYYNPDPADPKPWKVKNNWGVSGGNSVKSHNEFTESEFKREHERSGKWIVIIQGPPPPVKPQYVAWWQ